MIKPHIEATILNGLPATPQIYAQPRVPSFNMSDIAITKKMTLDDGSSMAVYFSVQNLANAVAPVVTGRMRASGPSGNLTELRPNRGFPPKPMKN